MQKEKDIIILAIESSCDETSAAILKNGREVMSNIISSQIAIHTIYGGVVPEIASRRHIENIDSVVDQAIKEANIKKEDIDVVAVTYGPGLVGALLVGVAWAKAFAFARKIPIVGVHHIKGHIAANYIEHKDLKPPYICLVVSGGHTNLVEIKDYTNFRIIGKTRDDAAGEAFDKVARSVGLGYPGGPKIDKLARQGDPYSITFPKAKVNDNIYDFSFSGIKSAVLNYINQKNMKNEDINKADLVASFQQAVVEVLTEHTIMAAKELGYNNIALAGGVAANSSLREYLMKECKDNNINLYYPSLTYCTDNAAMIGVAGYYEFINGTRHGNDLNAISSLSLE